MVSEKICLLVFGIITILILGVCEGFSFSSSGGLTYTQGSTLWIECALDQTPAKLEFEKNGISLLPWGDQHPLMNYEHKWTIATNGTLLPEFQQTNRYNLTLLNATRQLYRLEIIDLQPEDSGKIGCTAINDAGYSELLAKQFTVIGIPSRLEWLDESTDNATEIDEVTVREGEPPHIKCEVHFPTRQPQMRIHLNRQRLGMRPPILDDVTSSFTEVPGSVLRWGVVDGRLDSEFNVSYVSERLWLNYTHDGAILTCQAPGNAAGINVRKDLTLNIIYTPAIQCAESWLNSNGTVTLRCFVFSHPAPQVIWYTTHNNHSVTTGVTTSKEFDIHIYLSILTAPQKDKLQYSIRASNALGTTSISKTYIATNDGVTGTPLLNFVLGMICLVISVDSV